MVPLMGHQQAVKGDQSTARRTVVMTLERIFEVNASEKI
jgi:hypothetical protein